MAGGAAHCADEHEKVVFWCVPVFQSNEYECLFCVLAPGLGPETRRVCPWCSSCSWRYSVKLGKSEIDALAAQADGRDRLSSIATTTTRSPASPCGSRLAARRSSSSSTPAGRPAGPKRAPGVWTLWRASPPTARRAAEALRHRGPPSGPPASAAPPVGAKEAEAARRVKAAADPLTLAKIIDAWVPPASPTAARRTARKRPGRCARAWRICSINPRTP